MDLPYLVSWWGEEINVTSAGNFKRKLDQAAAELNSGDTLDIEFYCPGGQVVSAIALAAYIIELGKVFDVRTFALGSVCSAAIYPFLAGNKRLVNTFSRLGFHSVASRSPVKSDSVEGYFKIAQVMAEEENRYKEYVLSRVIQGASQPLRKVDLDLWMKTSSTHYLDSEEAIKTGLAHGFGSRFIKKQP